MQKEMSRYSAKLVADGGMPIEARIGVNTGEVVVRSNRTARRAHRIPQTPRPDLIFR
jgi:class 3 adenylate cyclase